MGSDKVKKLIEEQVGREYKAYQFYAAASAWFDLRGLNKFAKMFQDLADEELTHANKLKQFLLDRNYPCKQPAIDPLDPSKWSNVTNLVSEAVELEEEFGQHFEDISEVACDEGDRTAAAFLQWFLLEQVAGIKEMQDLLDLVSSGVNVYYAEHIATDEE